MQNMHTLRGKLYVGRADQSVEQQTIPSIPSRFETILLSNPRTRPPQGAFGSSAHRFNDPRTELPGPGAYAPSVPTQTNASFSIKGSFGASRGQRWHRRKFNPPAPGQYHVPSFVEETLSKKDNRKFGTAQFANEKTVVPRKLKNDSKPGPGSYTIRDSSLPYRSPSSTCLSSSFASKTRRTFDTLGNGGGSKRKRWDNFSSIPVERMPDGTSSFGGNNADLQRATAGNEQRHAAPSRSLSSPVFRSSTKRNIGDNRATKIPGPGSYDLGVYDLARTSSRSQSRSHSRSSIPLQVSILADVEMKRQRAQNRSTTPGPGTYSIDKKWSEKSTVSSSFFLSSNPRFAPVQRGASNSQDSQSSIIYPQLPGKRSFHLNVHNIWV